MPFVCINKPKEWTSHDIVAKLRSITGEKKIGHAGTLDPFATGVLIVAITRESTKSIDQFKALEKEYIATAQFGAVSDTQDSDGIITPHPHPATITQETLQQVLPKFIGNISQIPPMYSAKKIQGKKLYELARAGKTIARQPTTISISSIELLHVDTQNQQAQLRIVCGPGTYIRTLIHDIGQTLGCGAYASALTRTRIGQYSLDQCHEITQITTENWQSLTLANQA